MTGQTHGQLDRRDIRTVRQDRQKDSQTRQMEGQSDRTDERAVRWTERGTYCEAGSVETTVLT